MGSLQQDRDSQRERERGGEQLQLKRLAKIENKRAGGRMRDGGVAVVGDVGD